VKEAFIAPPTSETMEVNVEPSLSYFVMSICLLIIDFSFHSKVIGFKGDLAHG
jgi:hypothetical protein